MAMRAAQERLGPTPHIEEARRVRRGGFAGFFAKERFFIKALREAPVSAVTADIEEIDAVGQELIAEETIRTDTDFGAALSAALFGESQEAAAAAGTDETVGGGAAVLVAEDPGPVSVGPFAGGRNPAAEIRSNVASRVEDPLAAIPHLDAGRPPIPEPVPVDAPDWRLAGPAHPVPSGMGRVDWSGTALLRSGIPKVIVEAAAGLDQRDDLGWINAMADVIAPHCGDLPGGATVFVGNDVAGLAADLGIPAVEVMSTSLPAGSFAAEVPDTPEALDWLASVLADRNLHLVIGGTGAWLHLLVADPTGVSFTADTSVVDALYVALTLGAPLGFGTTGDDGITRMTPIDAALAIRRLVGRQ